jgi:hypothetical protein
MSKLIRIFALIALVVSWSLSFSDHIVFAQAGTVSPLKAPVTTYLQATGQTGTANYVTRISNTAANAWNAGVTTLGNAPQSVGPVPLGAGQTSLPGIGAVTPTGSYQQTLVIPNGVPVLGGWNTGIQTTVNTFVDTQGHRIEAAPDPLSAFNYAMTHSDYTGQQTGYALTTTFLGDWLSGNSGTGDGAFRFDPGLAMAMGSNFGNGIGALFGVGVYVYDPITGVASTPMQGDSSVTTGDPTSPPTVNPPSCCSSGEEVYLKAVIPQPAPEFTLEFLPPYPIVIGQDATKRGVDIQGRATLGPCTVIWHHVLREQYIYCGKERCDCNTDNCEVRESIKEWDTTDYEPDQMASATVDSSLSAKSIAYIQGPMQQIYPGARVQQAQVGVYPTGWARVADYRVSIPTVWTMLAERVPYADPGDWDFQATLNTTGTPHCGPLHWSKAFPGALTVWLREQRLIK